MLKIGFYIFILLAGLPQNLNYLLESRLNSGNLNLKMYHSQMLTVPMQILRLTIRSFLLGNRVPKMQRILLLAFVLIKSKSIFLSAVCGLL